MRKQTYNKKYLAQRLQYRKGKAYAFSICLYTTSDQDAIDFLKQVSLASSKKALLCWAVEEYRRHHGTDFSALEPYFKRKGVSDGTEEDETAN